jgi:hypothetical protein
MKQLLLTAALAITAFSTQAQAADVGVSVTIGQPGFYGRIDIGNYPYPQPRVIYKQPKVVQRVQVVREPIYLRVPPGHAKNWSKHCHRYQACGYPVYFVQDSWYHNDYAPAYQQYQAQNRQEHQHEDQHEYHHDNGNNQGQGNHDHGNHDQGNRNQEKHSQGNSNNGNRGNGGEHQEHGHGHH